MKKNTKKLLFLLHTPEEDLTKLPLKLVREVFAHLSDGGFRSWIFHLKGEGLVFVEQRPEDQYAYLTSKGQRAVRQLFPCLNPQWDQWDGSWQLLLFLKAPKGDRQFRYLRQLLLTERAMPLSRGSYLLPMTCSERVMHECQMRYADAVAIGTVKNWLYGLEDPVIVSYYDLNAKALLYSSIGKDIMQLLTQIGAKKRLINTQKKQLLSQLDRLFECALDDPGFLRKYFPEVEDARALLPKVHQLLLL